MNMYAVNVGNASMALRNSIPIQETCFAQPILSNDVEMTGQVRSGLSWENALTQTLPPEHPDAIDEDVISSKIQRNITHISDYSKLVYPAKMLTGKEQFRSGKPFEEQFIQPAAFCARLDEMNPHHKFTPEHYYAAWHHAICEAWRPSQLNLDYFKATYSGKTEWEFYWHLKVEKHKVIGSIRKADIKTFDERMQIQQKKFELKMERVNSDRHHYDHTKVERAAIVAGRFNNTARLARG